jgi:hypothetical protein
MPSLGHRPLGVSIPVTRAVRILAISICGLVVTPAIIFLWPGAQARERSCLDSWEGYARCYAPSQLATAEQQLPVIPIRPVTIVKQTARISLTKVVLTYYLPARLPLNYHLPGTINGIGYRFGSYNPGECTAPSKTEWADVFEIVGHSSNNEGVYLQLDCATLTSFIANIPDRNLTLTISSNLPRATLYKVGLDILVQTINVCPGRPLAAPHMTPAQVMRIAQARAGVRILPQSHTLQFGSLSIANRKMDVWALRLFPLTPPLHAGLILIDDVTAQVLRVVRY